MTFHSKADAQPIQVEPKPYYLESADEVTLFEAAFHSKLPLMLKGPTGCGKTRFVEYMAHRMNRPLITVSCHEDLFASDLLGRYILKKDEKTAVDWFKKAAEQGLVGSQMTLGMIYENGQGVEKNEVEARRWYKLAEENSQ